MDGVGWIKEHPLFDLGYWVTFTRDLRPGDLLALLADEIELKGTITWQQGKALEAELETNSRQMLRIGSAGDLTYAVGEYGPVSRKAPDFVRCVSIHGLAISFYCNTNAAKRVSLAEHGETVLVFNPATADMRAGVRSDYLLVELTEYGLIDKAGRRPLLGEEEVEERILALLENRFSLTLPKSMIEGGSVQTVLL